jgi:hypothetical protein
MFLGKSHLDVVAFGVHCQEVLGGEEPAFVGRAMKGGAARECDGVDNRMRRGIELLKHLKESAQWRQDQILHRA